MEGHNRFDYQSFRQQVIDRMKAGDKELTGKDGLLAPLLQDLMNTALLGEVQALVDESRPNRRNGGKTKQVKTPHGPFEVEMPRDRDGTFEPQTVGCYHLGHQPLIHTGSLYSECYAGLGRNKWLTYIRNI